MAQTVKIKRSSTTAIPSALENGELAYSSNSNKLVIGRPGGGTGDVDVIGGKLYIDMLDHTAGTLTASSAIIVDANSKIDVLNVDNITINGNAITSTDTNGNINITPNGTGSIVLDGQSWPQAQGTDNYFLTTIAGQLSWAAIPSGSFTLAADTGTPDAFNTGETLTFTGSTGIDTAVADNSLTFTLDLSELTTSTTDGDGDYFVVVDTTNGQHKLTKANIALSGFNNDSGWTSNTGTVTSVGGTGTVNGITLTGTVTTSGNLTLGGTLGGITVSQLDAAAVITAAETIAANDVDTALPTSAAVKAYVDAAVAGGVTYKGSYNASTNSPDLDVAASGVAVGDMYTVTTAGTFFEDTTYLYLGAAEGASFTVGLVVTGGTSGATGTIIAIEGDTLIVNSITGTFQAEALTDTSTGTGTATGLMVGVALEVGDVLIGEIAGASKVIDWTIVQRNILNDQLIDGGTF